MPPRNKQVENPEERPLFVLKTDPRDRERWALEYDELESRHIQALRSEGENVYNLKSLRQAKEEVLSKQRARQATVRNAVGKRRADREQTVLRQSPRSQQGTVSGSSFNAAKSLAKEEGVQRVRCVRPQSANPSRAHRMPAAKVVVVQRPASAASRHVVRSISPVDPPGSPTEKGLRRKDVMTLLRVLDTGTELHPFDVNTAGINLDWLGTARELRAAADVHVPALLGLSSLSGDSFIWDPAAGTGTLPGNAAPRGAVPQCREGGVRHSAVVNSPRSAYVLLSSGVSAYDLQRLPLSFFHDPTGRGGNPVAVSDVAQARQLRQAHEDQVTELHDALMQRYHRLCAHTSVSDVIACVTSTGDAAEGNPTFVEKQGAKSKRFLTACKTRLDREFQQMQQRHSAEHHAERERIRRVKALEEEKERKRQEQRRQYDLSQQRQAERKEAVMQKAREEEQQLVDRLHQLDARDTQRRIRMADADNLRRQKQDEARQIKQRLIQNSRDRQRELEEEARQRALEKERIAEERRLALQERDQGAKDELHRRLEAAASRRSVNVQRTMDLIQSRRERGFDKQAAAEEAMLQREEQRKQAQKLRADQQAQLAQQREEKRKAALQQEESVAEALMQKQAQKAAQYAARQSAAQTQHVLDHGMQLSEVAEKQFRVQCQHRATEFRKALMYTDIKDKEMRAELGSKMRADLIHQCWKDREELRHEKERLTRNNMVQIQKEKITLVV